jgi:hypothetical protein
MAGTIAAERASVRKPAHWRSTSSFVRVSHALT